MKRFTIIGMLLCILVILGLTGGSVIDPKKDVTGDKGVKVTWDTWRVVKTEASKALDEGKFDQAAVLFMEYVRQGEELKEPKIQAWGLNNAAYSIIMKHKLDRSTDLTKAAEYIERALALPGIDDQCRNILESNKLYTNYWVGKNTVIKPSNSTTKEAVPKKK